MKKAAAVLLAIVMAVPALAVPVCAAACGGAATGPVSCCCGPKAAPADGNPSYTAPPCCPSESTRADVGEADSAVNAGQGVDLAARAGQAAAAPVLLAAADTPPATARLLTIASGGARSTGPPIFLSISVLRI